MRSLAVGVKATDFGGLPRIFLPDRRYREKRLAKPPAAALLYWCGPVAANDVGIVTLLGSIWQR